MVNIGHKCLEEAHSDDEERHLLTFLQHMFGYYLIFHVPRTIHTLGLNKVRDGDILGHHGPQATLHSTPNTILPNL